MTRTATGAPQCLLLAREVLAFGADAGIAHALFGRLGFELIYDEAQPLNPQRQAANRLGRVEGHIAGRKPGARRETTQAARPLIRVQIVFAAVCTAAFTPVVTWLHTLVQTRRDTRELRRRGSSRGVRLDRGRLKICAPNNANSGKKNHEVQAVS